MIPKTKNNKNDCLVLVIILEGENAKTEINFWEAIKKMWINETDNIMMLIKAADPNINSWSRIEEFLNRKTLNKKYKKVFCIFNYDLELHSMNEWGSKEKTRDIVCSKIKKQFFKDSEKTFFDLKKEGESIEDSFYFILSNKNKTSFYENFPNHKGDPRLLYKVMQKKKISSKKILLDFISAFKTYHDSIYLKLFVELNKINDEFKK